MFKNIYKKIIYLVSIFLGFNIFNLIPAYAFQNAEKIELELQVPLLDYKKAQNFPEYLGKLIEYSLYVLIPIAIIVIMYAGFLWIMAAGNNTKILAAKKFIISAVTGIILGTLSIIVLNLIGITELRMPGIEYLEAGPDENFEILELDTENENHSDGAAGGDCFPIAEGDLRAISWNFGDRRTKGKNGPYKRCHAGVDIKTHRRRSAAVLAVSDGEVIRNAHFYNCSGGASKTILIYHSSMNKTINYGEINNNAVAPGMSAGSQVKAGQYIGEANFCGMLHFELYEGKVARHKHWYSASVMPAVRNYCVKNNLGAKPAEMLDPTETLRALESKKCQKP